MAAEHNTATRNASATPSPQELLKLLAQHLDYRGMRPFAMVDSDHASDRCAQYLSHATCLLSFMSAAYEDMQALAGKSLGSEVANRTGTVISGALDGVASLIDLAAFLLAEGR